MRRSVAAAVLTALALTVVPAVANAADGPVIDWAGSVNEDLGTLQVAARADAGIAELRAYVVSYATGQDVAVVNDLTLHSGTVNNGVWRTPKPLQLSEYRGYRVDVEATDTAGGKAPRRAIGSLAYYVDTTMTLTPKHTTVTYTRREIKVTGVMTGKWPDTREVKPVVGETVSMSNVWGGWYADVTTASDGSFKATVPFDNSAFYEDMAFVDAVFGPNGPYLRASADFTVTPDPAKSRITAQVSKRRVDKGESVVLSGQLTYREPEQGWTPIPNANIGVLFCVTEDYCPTSVAYPQTDAEGRFELTVTPWETGFYRIGYGSPDVFIGNGRGQADIVVYQLAEFNDFTAVRDASGTVTASGHIRFGNVTPGTIPVHIQFRAAGASDWTTVATVPDAQWDGTGGHAFSAQVTGQPAGSWRAFYPGAENVFRPTYSAKVNVP